MQEERSTNFFLIFEVTQNPLKFGMMTLLMWDMFSHEKSRHAKFQQILIDFKNRDKIFTLFFHGCLQLVVGGQGKRGKVGYVVFEDAGRFQGVKRLWVNCNDYGAMTD